MAMWLFTDAILAGRPIKLFNHGRMRRDFTYVDDVTEAVVRLVERRPTGDATWSGDRPDPATSRAPWRVYNIGNHQPVELMRYIEVLESCLGKKAILDLQPIQPGDVPSTYADTAELQAATGFKPATTVETGVRRFVEWYREYYK
jgi:UDP-glucuronate 4-epimerase